MGPTCVPNDGTVGKRADILAMQPRGLLPPRDARAGWLGGMSRCSRDGADRSFRAGARGGRVDPVERVTRAPSRLERLSVAVPGGIQPDRPDSLPLRTEDDGLPARFPVVARCRCPPCAPGRCWTRACRRRRSGGSGRRSPSRRAGTGRHRWPFRSSKQPGCGFRPSTRRCLHGRLPMPMAGCSCRSSARCMAWRSAARSCSPSSRPAASRTYRPAQRRPSRGGRRQSAGWGIAARAVPGGRGCLTSR